MLDRKFPSCGDCLIYSRLKLTLKIPGAFPSVAYSTKTCSELCPNSSVRIQQPPGANSGPPYW
jgi:hypothetical protein